MLTSARESRWLSLRALALFGIPLALPLAACDETTLVPGEEDKSGVNLINGPGKSTGNSPSGSGGETGSGGAGSGGTGVGGQAGFGGGGTQGQDCAIPADCDDNNPCSIDSCVSAVCQQRAAADDKNACTIDTCDPETGQITNIFDADDDVCTFDVCIPASGVTHPFEIELFVEDFSTNDQGWVGTWTIGSAALSVGANENGNDPSSDNSAEGDGQAGTVGPATNGGLVSHSTTYILTSPPIDVSSVQTGEYVGLRVYRWLDINAQDTASITVLNGTANPVASWTSAGQKITDNPAATSGRPGIGWFELRINITQAVATAKANNLPIRLEFRLVTGNNAAIPNMGGFNIDDVKVVRSKVPFDNNQCTLDGCIATTSAGVEVPMAVPFNLAFDDGDPCTSFVCNSNVGIPHHTQLANCEP